jgi:alkanesulfonate monooxygenase SsuD/methylene tetrahydromethanopterin reductase-like flavin-dependent oxidoreductase (luciferase family)
VSADYRRPIKVGLFLGLFDGFMGGRSPAWADIMAMAQRAEAVGFDSVWLPDHFLIPATPIPEPGGVWECGAMLAALAAVTTRVELGTLVLCTGFRNPTLIAKMADTIDEISGGRLILGLGAGYFEPEYRAFGYSSDHRSSRFAEALQIISSLLRTGTVDLDGTYYQAHIDGLTPRGPRPNGPPILIGSSGPKGLRLTARYADAWNTGLWSKNSRPEDLEPGMNMVNEACKEVGRDPATLERTAGIHWSATQTLTGVPGWMQRFGPPLTTGPDETADLFRMFAQAGVSHLQVIVSPNTMEGIEAFAPVLNALDRSSS